MFEKQIFVPAGQYRTYIFNYIEQSVCINDSNSEKEQKLLNHMLNIQPECIDILALKILPL